MVQLNMPADVNADSSDSSEESYLPDATDM